MSNETENKEPEKDKVADKVAEIVSIHDFKSMLIGMDLILGDDWTPDEHQWKRIRKKIDALIETAERPGGVATSFPPHVPGNPVINAPVVDPNSRLSEDQLLQSFPAVPAAEGVPIGEGAPVGPSALTPMPRVPNAPMPQAAPIADGTGDKVKTPDIDSSQGYKSGFV